MATMSGGEALVRSLVREGVEYVFGIPGIHMYGIVAAIRDEPTIQLITTRHEQAATYMAERLCAHLRQAGGGPRGPRGGSVQRRLRDGHRLRSLLARAGHRRPGAARPDWQGHRGRARGAGPGRYGALRHQVATRGVTTAGDPDGRDRGLPPDAQRPPSSRPDRDPARGGRGARGRRAVGSSVRLADRAEPGPVAGSRPHHRRIAPASHLRRRWSGSVGRRGGPRAAGRGDQHPRRHVERRQGDHPGQPPALVRLVLQPSR